MDIKVYTGESYNVFTHETRTSYVMVDRACRSCSCKDSFPLAHKRPKA